MGRFLAIGLPHQIFVRPVERNSRHAPSLSEVRDEMERSLLYDMSLFDSEEKEGSYVFTIRNEPLREGLIPFLENFYPKVYLKEYGGHDSDRGYQSALERLRTTPAEQWIDFAREKINYAFQLSTHSGLEYLEIQKDFLPVVSLSLDCVILYLGDGKIATEGIGDVTRFFKFCLREAFAEHPIAKAVEIYVTI